MILERIADAELVFIGQEYRDLAFQSEIRGKLENPSANSSRIRFECFESAAEELNSYQQLDVSLDPFLVSSPQRAFESLWMGVPVVTHRDERLSGRSVASILAALRRNAWIVTNHSDYVIAVEQLAERRTITRSQRAQLRSELLDSSMCNVASMASNIRAAIDESVRRINLITNTR
jgi:predicted O-linked N-acetylglucosamine transferase (SPINDLY family)